MNQLSIKVSWERAGVKASVSPNLIVGVVRSFSKESESADVSRNEPNRFRGAMRAKVRRVSSPPGGGERAVQRRTASLSGQGVRA